jgi:hypothetical protein
MPNHVFACCTPAVAWESAVAVSASCAIRLKAGPDGDRPGDGKSLAPDFGGHDMMTNIKRSLISDRGCWNGVQEPNADAKNRRLCDGERNLTGQEREGTSRESNKEGAKDSGAGVIGRQQSVYAT